MPLAADAVGPVNMELTGVTYEAAECPAALKAGRIGGAFGGAASKEVTQQCVKVSATALNPTKAALKECAVFGFVLDEQVGGGGWGCVGWSSQDPPPPLKETWPVCEISVRISSGLLPAPASVSLFLSMYVQPKLIPFLYSVFYLFICRAAGRRVGNCQQPRPPL
jgi:hypothetical protein